MEKIVITKITEDIKKMKIDWKWESNNDGFGGTFNSCNICCAIEDDPESIHACAFQNEIIDKIINKVNIN